MFLIPEQAPPGGVEVGVAVGVLVGVAVGVFVGVAVGVAVGVGVATPLTSSAPLSYNPACGRVSLSKSLVTDAIAAPVLYSVAVLVMWRSFAAANGTAPVDSVEALSFVTLPSMLVYAASAARLGKVGGPGKGLLRPIPCCAAFVP